ncbi:MAG TPA: stalk domain-containing protein, partial [Candidatus Cryosericum sp.]
VQFSSNVTMPPVFEHSYVTVNGMEASAVTLLSTGKLSVTTPVTINNNQQVTVVFAPEFGITNPSTAPATVTIQVSTSKDVSAVSTSYTTTTSQITQPQVTLTTNGVGKASGYTVTFQTGAGGALSAGSGRIYLTLPAGTSVPASIAAQNIRVNGATASIVTSSTGNRRVEVTTPVAILANSQVQVVIDAAANITNPSTARTDYTLSAYTTAEATPVTSATYSIVNLPTTTAVTSPSAPDGLNGYYKTRPTVSLTATSPSGLAVTIYYRINAGSDTQYSSPIQLPEGSVTLSYYARDTQGNQEPAKQLTFKIDSTVPVITITAPLEGSATGNANITVIGRTEAGASVVINSSPVATQATGDFTGSVTLHEGANAIQITATDLAGNIGQARVNVTLDTKPPVLTMTSPKIYSTVMAQKVAVSGKTEPGATVTVAGAQVNVAADGSFSIMYMFPKEGLNVIDVTSTDAAGNVAKMGVPVTYVARTLIRLQVGNKTAMINDTTKTLQAAPINVKGTVMVPIRFIGEAFGATVEWEPVLKIVRLQLGSTIIYLQMGYNYASVNGKKIVLQGLPSIISGTTMVPIRFISEAFNAQVTWIAATQGVEITYPKP